MQCNAETPAGKLEQIFIFFFSLLSAWHHVTPWRWLLRQVKFILIQLCSWLPAGLEWLTWLYNSSCTYIIIMCKAAFVMQWKIRTSFVMNIPNGGFLKFSWAPTAPRRSQVLSTGRNPRSRMFLWDQANNRQSSSCLNSCLCTLHNSILKTSTFQLSELSVLN